MAAIVDEQHWMTIPKFWPKPIPRLFLRYQIFRNGNRAFFPRPNFFETDTFLPRPNFPKPKPRLFSETKFFRNRNRNPQRFGKSFETEKFRNRNVNLWWRGVAVVAKIDRLMRMLTSITNWCWILWSQFHIIKCAFPTRPNPRTVHCEVTKRILSATWLTPTLLTLAAMKWLQKIWIMAFILNNWDLKISQTMSYLTSTWPGSHKTKQCHFGLVG